MAPEKSAVVAPDVNHPSSRGRLLLPSTDMGMGGGAEEQVIHLAIAMHRRGWKVCIDSMLPPSPMPLDFDYSAIPVHHLGMRRKIADPRCILRFAKLVREFRPGEAGQPLWSSGGQFRTGEA
jgi:hypothetical protein